MKKLILALFAALNTFAVFAQAPEKISYQAVIRDNNNQLVVNQVIKMRLGIYRNSISGTKVFEEIQTPTTNVNGLATLQIGTGTVVTGLLDTISWENGPYFLKREIDITGGTNYNITGSSELVSVPYAFHSNKVENYAGGAYKLNYSLAAINYTNPPVTVLTTTNNWVGDRRILLNGYINLEFTFPASTFTNNAITTGFCNIDFYLKYDGQTIMPINLKNYRIGGISPNVNTLSDKAQINLPITAIIPNSTPGTGKQFSIVCPNNQSFTDANISINHTPIDVKATVVLSWLEL